MLTRLVLARLLLCVAILLGAAAPALAQTPSDLQTAINNTPWNQSLGQISGTQIEGLFNQTLSVFNSSLPGLSDTLNPGGQNVPGLNAVLSAAGTSSGGSANQSGWYIQATSNATSSAASYQKNGLFVWAFQNDPSALGTINRDLVAITSFATSNVANGRIWGMNSSLDNGGNSVLMTGWECDIKNTYQNEHTGSTNDASACITIVPTGTYDITVGVLATNNGGGFGKVYDAFVAAGVDGRAFVVASGYGAGETDYLTIGGTGLLTANDTVVLGNAAFTSFASGQGELTGNGTYGLALVGFGGTSDVTLFNKSQAAAAYVPTNTTNFAIVGKIVGGTSSLSGVGLSLQNSVGTCTFTATASGSSTQSCSSDRRLKTGIRPAASELAWLDSFAISDYTVIADGEDGVSPIAQDAQTNHPEMVTSDDRGYLMLQAPSPWRMMKAMQELEAANDNLSHEIEDLRHHVGVR